MVCSSSAIDLLLSRPASMLGWLQIICRYSWTACLTLACSHQVASKTEGQLSDDTARGRLRQQHWWPSRHHLRCCLLCERSHIWSVRGFPCALWASLTEWWCSGNSNWENNKVSRAASHVCRLHTHCSIAYIPLHHPPAQWHQIWVLSCHSQIRGCHSINKLQNGIILLFFKIWKIQSIDFLRNLILSNSCELYYDDITVTSFVNDNYGNVTTESIP